MKDLYELLNEVNIDESEFKEMEVNYIEKKKLKKNLRKNIKKKSNWKKKTIVAANIIFVLTASSGIAFPSYSKNMPIVGDIFRAIDTCKTGIYDNFKENANEINSTKISNGIEITLNEVIFNGRTLNLTYTVKTDRDLGKYISLGGEATLKGKGIQSGGGSSRFEQVDKNTYIGIQDITFTDFVDNPKDKISFDLKINEIYWCEEKREDSESAKISGNWNFEVEDLKAIKGITEIINKSVEKEGVIITINEISKYPMSTFVSYSQKVTDEFNKKWKHARVSLEARDDLGNIYLSQDNGGSGTSPNNIDWSTNFGTINKGAKKLIITPKLDISNKDKVNGSMERISLEEIEIDLEK